MAKSQSETINVKEKKMNVLIHQYENFTMKSKIVKQMFEKLNLPVDDLEHLGKICNNFELVRFKYS